MNEIEEAASGADSVVIDLEEPRTPFPESERERARESVRPLPRHVGERPTPRCVRPGPARSTGQTLRDLRAVMHPHLAGILLPKVEGPADIHGADALLSCLEVEAGLPHEPAR